MEKLKQLTSLSLNELRDVDEEYTEYLALTIKDFISRNKISTVDLVSSHGHTALHQPNKNLTYQIGNHQELANILKMKVICDFRVQDVEFGGQGAPLVPIGDKLLFNEFDYCLNLGGFANISFQQNKKRIAFDICPVNIILNHYVSTIGLSYDNNGELASRGNIDSQLFEDLNNLPYYFQSTPKSLGLEWVKENIFPIVNNNNHLDLNDVLCTLVEHIAYQIARVINVDKQSILITGGGAYNTYLIERIQNYVSSYITIPDEKTIDFKEALIFAFLGVLKERNEVNCLASVTGAIRDHSSGKILFPQI